MPFFCTICGEESESICVRCTKDACSNHLCERCRRCSDCCECELTLEPPAREAPHHTSHAAPLAEAAQAPADLVEPETTAAPLPPE